MRAAYGVWALLACSCGPSLSAPFSFSNIPCGGVANGINNAGAIVGASGPNSAVGGYIYSGGTCSTIPLIAGYEQYQTWAGGINNSGVVAGSYWNGAYGVVGLTFDGSNVTLVHHAGASDGATAINDSGLVAGWGPGVSAWLWNGLTFSVVQSPTPGMSVSIGGIDDAGDIVGTEWQGGGGYEGAFLLAGGVWTQLHFPGADGTFAYGINNTGIIVGEYSLADGSVHGFIYDGGAWSTVDNPAGSDSGLRGINDRGEVVGWYGDYRNSQFTSFLGSPVPEPSALLLVAAGLIVALAARRAHFR